MYNVGNEARTGEDGEDIPLRRQTEPTTSSQEDEVNSGVNTDKVVPSQTTEIDEVRPSRGDLTHRDASNSVTDNLSVRQELESEQIINTFEERGEQRDKNNSGSRSQASSDGDKATSETVLKTSVDKPSLKPTNSAANRDKCVKQEVDPLPAGSRSTRPVAIGLEGSPAVIGGLSNQVSDQV